MIDFKRLPSPCYVLDERLLRANLEKIADVARRADVVIIVALKACAMWSIFPIMKEYVHGATASSLAEARLVFEEFGTQTHTYAPVYTDGSIEEIMRYTSHLTFNSLSQFDRFGAGAILRGISCGLRVNPDCSVVDTELYDPSSPNSRLGILSEHLPLLPDGIEGLHFHALCESSADDLEKVLASVEHRFGHLFAGLKWINMGGGHLMTRRGYDLEKLINLLRAFKSRHPHLRVILEPGSAFTWQTGYLVSTVEDIVYGRDTKTAMLDVSFACHMPDCLEMPYKPSILGAHDPAEGESGWRMGGNSCLAGDYMGDWSFDEDPQPGTRIVFNDMIHYTMVKTTMFNGVAHPAIAIAGIDGETRIIREFGYEDFKNRMS